MQVYPLLYLATSEKAACQVANNVSTSIWFSVTLYVRHFSTENVQNVYFFHRKNYSITLNNTFIK